MPVTKLMIALQQGNHLHVCFGFVFVENLEPVLNRLTILSLNRGKVALRAFDFFAHAKMLQVAPIFYLLKHGYCFR